MDKNDLEWKYGYKLLRRDNGRLFSCSLPVGLRQEYWIGRPTKRRGGKWGALTLFADHYDAKDLRCFYFEASLQKQLTIFYCRYIPADKIKIVALPTEELTDTWVRDMNGRIEYHVFAGFIQRLIVPSGTIYADTIELIREVTS